MWCHACPTLIKSLLSSFLSEIPWNMLDSISKPLGAFVKGATSGIYTK